MGTITKALELLDLFSRDRREIGLGEFVRLSGRDKASVHRYLGELEQNGFVEQHPQSRAYRLGPAILRLSAVREATHPVRSVLRPIVTGLAEEVGELVHVSLLDGDMLSPVIHVDPRRHGTQVAFDEAEKLPLHATASGMAVLAFGPPALLDRALRLPRRAITEDTVTDPDTLRALVDRVRRDGISRLDRTFDREVTSQGAPIFGPDGIALGAMSVAVPSVRADAGKLDAIAGPLRDTAAAATRSLGGVIPADHPVFAA
ncbi:helix-turn-helix domain-containing protein [Rhodobacterales bacterium HKCCE3408]|nr:helix-turn-helix domain-containing protein [Rhodobacterales bacterium HKCCE3408]